MPSKIRIKIGDVEVEYEGSDEFLKKELPELIKCVSSLRLPLISLKGNQGQSGLPLNKQSTSAFMAKMGKSSGSNLVLAACYHLSSSGSEHYTTKEISKAMRDAKTYYKRSYSNNMDNSLKTLVSSGKLNELGGGKYSLNATSIEECRSLIAKEV